MNYLRNQKMKWIFATQARTSDVHLEVHDFVRKNQMFDDPSYMVSCKVFRKALYARIFGGAA